MMNNHKSKRALVVVAISFLPKPWPDNPGQYLKEAKGFSGLAGGAFAPVPERG